MTHLLNDVTWRCAWRHRWWLRHRGSDWMVVRRRCFVAAEYLLRPERGAEYCSERVCISVCFFSHHDHIFRTTRPIFAIFFVRVTYGRGSVLFWRRSDTLRISVFIDDVIFAHKLRLLNVGARLRQWGSHAGLSLARIPIAGSGRSGLLLAVRAY